MKLKGACDFQIVIHDSKVFEIMMLAHDMGLDELRNECEEHVVSSLTSENACTLLTTLMKMPEKIGKCFVSSLCFVYLFSLGLCLMMKGGMNDSFYINALTGVNESPGVHSHYFAFEFLSFLNLQFSFSFTLILVLGNFTLWSKGIFTSLFFVL